MADVDVAMPDAVQYIYKVVLARFPQRTKNKKNKRYNNVNSKLFHKKLFLLGKSVYICSIKQTDLHL